MAIALKVEFAATLRRTPRIVTNLRVGVAAPFAAISREMVEMARQSILSGRDPWGKQWAPLSPATLAIYARGGFERRRGQGRNARGQFRRAGTGAVRPIVSKGLLRGTDRLLQSLSPIASTKSAGVSIGVPWWRVHQFGNPRNRLPNKAGGNLAPIPARPFLPIRPGGKVDPPGDAKARWGRMIRVAISTSGLGV